MKFIKKGSCSNYLLFYKIFSIMKKDSKEENFNSLNENLISEFSIQQLEERLETNPLSLFGSSLTVGQCVVSPPCVSCIACVACVSCIACVTSA